MILCDYPSIYTFVTCAERTWKHPEGLHKLSNKEVLHAPGVTRLPVLDTDPKSSVT